MHLIIIQSAGVCGCACVALVAFNICTRCITATKAAATASTATEVGARNAKQRERRKRMQRKRMFGCCTLLVSPVSVC